MVAIGKPVFAAVSQIAGRQCARRRKHVGLQPVQDAEILEITRVSSCQQYVGCDAPLAYFAHKTSLPELIFMAPQPLLSRHVTLGRATRQFLRNCDPAMAPDPEVIWGTPVA